MTRGLRRRLTSYGDQDFSLFLRKAFIKAMGYSDDALDRPIVGIANTYSDYNPCHGNVPQLIEAAKRGVMLAGGMPMVFPTMSIHESFASPTSMFLRNLMAMETEELVRAQPMDSVILIGGCDKTIPAQVMAAASSEVPAIVLPTGPMDTGSHRGERLGACTDCRRIWAQYRADQIDADEVAEINGKLASSVGTCTVMGTASTMAALMEAMGLSLPMAGSASATSSERMRLAEETGRAAVAMTETGLTTAEVLTPAALRNGLVTLQALGGSTNAVVHLAAIYGRLGKKLDMAEFDAIGQKVPVLVDLKPTGTGYMGEFHAAGGVPRLLSELTDLLDLAAPRAFGGTLGDTIGTLPARYETQIIRPRTAPISPAGAIAVLSGNLAPRGAVIKHAAADPKLQVHEGRAVVFDSVRDMTERLDDPSLDIAADDVLVLRNAGPKGAPGMPEAGYIPIPRHLARQGVKDMVRLSDARMSGTAFGTVVLHITPESADGGPLAAVRTGDRIRLDVPNRRLELLISATELAARMAALPAPPPSPPRGYAQLYDRHVTQADDGLDFDFLMAAKDHG
ncbi:MULTISPECIES: dihydroxy-acid dehydratase [unclassified Devosia]|uniref:dihydroxy-acid dehydratase n=1 Tax=unclassified Devosia TaxID=196773 RepID=UPI000712A4E0|nr:MULTISPECIES: dihydroxy-acid dehydratase [unclassified Devosia]KQN71507.1 dihydroxy-acid dehydratase [Devosia sp. Leaf64]KQT45771.1 dihydroxy-acid dehydratase [Devosia sp. Leaf420]